MNNDLKRLRQFLELPVGTSDGVFERFAEIPRSIFIGQDQERFLYVRGHRDNKVLLVAHADTVWDRHYKRHYDGNHELRFDNGIIKSGTKDCGIGADDRSGCAIVWLLQDFGHSILITDGEEGGKTGASWLMSDNKDIAEEINSNHQFVIQFDRRNGADFKCYCVGTDEFRSYVAMKTGYVEPDRTQSTDICVLCEKITGVNLSIGFYNEHTNEEYLVIAQWQHTLNLARKWLSEPDLPRFSL